MQDSHFSEMRWYSEISTAAFCESLELRRILLQKRQSFGRGIRRPPLLEPASAEFISALAAGINSRHTLQVGCGLSTLALAAAARATNSCLLSVHHEVEKQRVLEYFLKEMSLTDHVEFITEDPSTFIPRSEGLDFVLLSGQPERYIELFDLLRLKKGAIVVADNALDDSTNDYIRHVRRQPGVDSSTLPLSRGIEVTKIITWEAFNRGRKKFNGIEELMNDKGYMRRPGLQEVVGPASSSSPRFSAHSGDASHNFDKDAETDRMQPELMTSELLESGWESPVHSHELDKSGYVTPTVEELDKLEVLEHEVIGSQFESMQSLAEQWRIQLAALAGSSGTSLSSVEESRPGISDSMISHFNNSVSITSPHHAASENLELESPQELDLENNGASLPSSDASMTENVAPEPEPEPEPVETAEDVLPLEDAEDVLPVEDVVPVLEEPAFWVSFQNENGQTEVTVEGVDQDMLLFDLTLAFKETGVSDKFTPTRLGKRYCPSQIVKKAKISTQDTLVSDVFNVVDGTTRGPLSEPRQEEVRKRILERLAERRPEQEDK